MSQLKPRQLDIMQTLTSILARKGPVNITTSLLAKECGITEAAIYRHFPSKRKIYSGLVDFCEQNLFDLITKINTDIKDPLKRVEKILTVLVAFCEKNPGMAKLLTREAFSENESNQNDRIIQIFAKIELHLKQNLQKYEQETKKKLILASASCANLLLCHTEGLIQQFVRSGFESQPTEKLQLQFKPLINSIVN